MAVQIADSPTQKMRSYYRFQTCVPFEEDATHEFKGHVNLCREELPPWTVLPNTDKRTRDRISKSLNAFLNSEQAATVYLGITDDGHVMGIPLTAFKMDHLTSSINDLFSRYNPPVESHRYSVEFVPVVEASATEDEIIKTLTFDPGKHISESERKKNHLLRTYTYCWCQKDFLAQINNGFIPARYVVEIHIAAWDPNDKRNTNSVGRMNAPPFHEDECGEVYIRQLSAARRVNQRELHEMVRQSVNRYYSNMIKRLSEELRQLKLHQKDVQTV